MKQSTENKINNFTRKLLNFLAVLVIVMALTGVFAYFRISQYLKDQKLQEQIKHAEIYNFYEIGS